MRAVGRCRDARRHDHEIDRSGEFAFLESRRAQIERVTVKEGYRNKIDEV